MLMAWLSRCRCVRVCLFGVVIFCSVIQHIPSALNFRISCFIWAHILAFEHITFFGVSSGQDLSLHSNRTEAGAKMSGRAASTSGLIEGQGRGEDRAAASYHRRTNSGDGSTIDRPARGQGESFTYSRFVEESRAADDVAEMTKFAVSVSSCKAGTQIYIDNNFIFFFKHFRWQKKQPFIACAVHWNKDLGRVSPEHPCAAHVHAKCHWGGAMREVLEIWWGFHLKSHILQKCQIWRVGLRQPSCRFSWLHLPQLFYSLHRCARLAVAWDVGSCDLLLSIRARTVPFKPQSWPISGCSKF